MIIPATLLGGLTPDAFLAEYWQKKPLLVRGALPGFEAPITPDELAGLACEEEVAARLVLEQGGEYPWQLFHGPFAPDDFKDLPPTHWTLLVQEVDRWVPAVAALLDHFRFLPNWRLDDVMISYAPREGGVGAHVDNYDVFLLQGRGRRRWQINHTPVVEENLVLDADVRVLEDFVPDAEWVLEPGDLLYLPPRIPHNGVALDDCMTISIGFRAPAHADLMVGFLQHVAEEMDPMARYADPDLRVPADPGLLDEGARARVRRLLREAVADDAAIDRWFGQFITTPSRGLAGPVPEVPYTPEEVRAALASGARLRRVVPNLAYFVAPGGTALLYAGGEEYTLADPEAAALLCGTLPLTHDALAPYLDQPGLLDVLAALVSEGHLQVEG